MSNPNGLPDLPEAPPSRLYGQGYSSRHPVPTVQRYRESQKIQEKEAEEYQRQLEALRQQREEAERAKGAHHPAQPTTPPSDSKDQEGKLDNVTIGSSTAVPSSPSINGAHDDLPLEEDPNVHRTGHINNVSTKAGEKKVTTGRVEDKAAPINQGTKGQAKVQGAHANSEKQEIMDQMNANQLKPTERLNKRAKGDRRVRDPTTGGEVIIHDANPKDFDASVPSTKPSNVLLHPFPPPAPVRLGYMQHKIQGLGLASAVGLTAIWIFTAFGHGYKRFFWVSLLCSAVGAILVTLINIISRSLEKEVESIRMDMHRQRGAIYSPPTPESVEWLNSMIKLVWGLVNPSMFIPIADMVEDIMQQSLPGFVDAVRISDIGQGDNPLRILSIRALADVQSDPDYPREHWINKGDTEAQSKDTAGKILEEDQAGDYYNFEVAFAYTSAPGHSGRERAHNIHLLLEFFLGVYDWLHIPIPIWIQVEEIVGTVRVRLQMIPEAPFVRNLTFTLCGVPFVDISAIPMSKKLPNVLDLPLVSQFVKSSIAAGTAELCAPKSMTLNLQELLSGSAVGDTRAVGVFVITVHFAEDLSAQDSNGKSDPYLILAYAKFGKPLYSTRIILEDLNPVWEETAVLLVTEDEINSKEELSVMLWDSDAHSADDLIGRVQIPIEDLMKQPNKMMRREDGLKGFEDADKMQGVLHWSVGFFEKVPLKRDLQRALTKEEKEAQPAPTKTAPEMEMRPDDQAPNPAKKDLPPPPPDVLKTRPDPEYPSGVFSVIVHQITNLERQQLDGKKGDREGEAGQDTDEASEASDNLPSGYCEIIVNDDMVYKTRVKQYTTNPYYEAGTEVFLRDFKDGVLRVVVRDSRLREADPILGVVSLRLADVFKDSSSVTRTYALTEGVGFGKINISLVFRGMKVKFPPNQLGWSTGTLQVGDVRMELEDKYKHLFHGHVPKLSIKGTDTAQVLHKKEGEVHDGAVYWSSDGVRLPIYSRYASSLIFDIGSRTSVASLIGKSGPEAIAVLWLQDLQDDVEQEVKIPIFTGPHLKNLRQNVINDQTAKHHEFELVGFLTCILKLDSGLDLDHEKLTPALSQARRHALEAYNRVEGEAARAEKNSHAMDDGVIDKHEAHEIKKAHQRELIARGRGPAQFKPYRQLKWMEKGLKSRLVPKSTKSREPTVQTEA